MALIPRDPAAFTLSAGRKRPKPLKHHDYLAWLHGLPCVTCGAGNGIEAAHVRYGSIAHGKAQAGLAQKPHDAWALPLCNLCHREGPDAQHKTNERKWWRGHGIDPLIICALLYVAFTVGDEDAGLAIIRSAREHRS